MEQLLLKVCGMREPDNIDDLVCLAPDFIGLIFYPGSSRYVKTFDNKDRIISIPSSIKKVGVFVNESLKTLLEMVNEYRLDYVQLHGGESLAYCQQVKEKGVKVIKVFSVQDELDPHMLKQFDEKVDYFLFDTKTSQYGGSGKTFNWEILKDYDYNTPYWLSGGIGIEELKEINRKDFPLLIGLDVNSKLEDRPGFKNTEMVEELKKSINS